ncbi:hypothetical protein [Paenibacillus sp. y28]|uniref:hypothetical protein n=1 Tax=Paenibacillus sp. y28 TaxID=3129110 RepID=UPI003017EC22
MEQGALAFVLVAGLPAVTGTANLENEAERQLFETITASYMPLLEVMEDLASERIPLPVGIALQPRLLQELNRPCFAEKYETYLENCIAEAGTAIEQCSPGLEQEQQLRRLDQLLHCLNRFGSDYGGRLIQGITRLAGRGRIELLTAAESSPEGMGLLADDVEQGLRMHTSLTGEAPRGIWLPESGTGRGPLAGAGQLQRLRGLGLEYAVTGSLGGEENRYPLLRHSAGQGASLAGAQDFPLGATTKGIKVHRSDAAASRLPVHLPGKTSSASALPRAEAEAWLDRRSLPLETDLDERSHHRRRYASFPAASPWEESAWARNRAFYLAEGYIRERQAQLGRFRGMLRPPFLLAAFEASVLGGCWLEGPVWFGAVLRYAAELLRDSGRAACQGMQEAAAGSVN